MAKRRVSERSVRNRLGLGVHRAWAPFRPWFESLEERTMLDATSPSTLPLAIVLGRTLATPSTAGTASPSPSYFVGEVQNNQVTITFTVYNEQAGTETGVLLTDTLAPGVTIVSSSVTLDGTTTPQLPDQSGQNLAISMAPIQGFDRESVALTVDLASSTSLQLDLGAHAFAMLNAGAVSTSTPAATLQPGNVSDPSLLASTVDADTNDPFIQEEAAALGYNPTNIFNYLHTQVGYNSYLGSVRGARGTLWSSAGNALDVASLGVALMRASGFEAQYVAGTLSQSQAQTLILSMFPASYQTVGYIPAGTQVSDPANDPQLLAETESHYWFQFDAGSGMQDADPLMPSATIGQTFTTATATLTAVPQSLEATTEVQLVAEVYSQADAAFGVNPFQDTTVLDRTFDDVELVGRPLTVGNFVDTSSIGTPIFTSVTNTYTPYIVEGDEALPASDQPEAITGTPYQEVLTNFPLSSQILTGLFLNVTLNGPGTAAQTFSQTLVDRIGYAARQGVATPKNLSVSPSNSPIITPLDLTTLNILAGLQDPVPAQILQRQATQQGTAVSRESAPTVTAQTTALVAFARSELATFVSVSDRETANLERGFSVAAYSSIPRITTFSSHVVTANSQATISYSMNLLHDTLLVIAAPGQNVQAALAFATARGIFDSVLEGQVLPSPAGGQNLSAVAVVQQSVQQGISLVEIQANNLSSLHNMDMPADAIAQITASVQNGLTVIVPRHALIINGTPTTAWFDFNPTTGEMIAENQDGEYQGFEEYAFLALAAGVILPPVAYLAVGAYQTHPKETLQVAKGATIVVLGFIPGGEGLLPIIVKIVQTVLGGLAAVDPPTAPVTLNLDVPYSTTIQGPTASTEATVEPSLSPGKVHGSVQASSEIASGNLAASWTTATICSFLASSLSANVATVVGSQDTTVGSGKVALSTKASLGAAVSGNAGYSVDGQGNLSLYGPAEASLGVSGNWQIYTATVTGNVSITLTVPAGTLTLNGQPLPAGTYTITTNSAALSGSGTMSAPNFAGSASITATDGTINLGPGSGNLSVGGTPLKSDDETTLDGYSGTITVSANGDGTDAVSLNGNTSNVLQVTTTPATLTTDQNTPVTFATDIQTSLADTYNLTANAPVGWTVSIDSKGNVTATPAPGLQAGTYPIQIIAQSQTNANLVAQTTVEVTITPTQPGINFAVAADPQFTVPFNGAQLPTAFRASIQNLGPQADTYNLTFSNVPSGFTLLNSGTTVTVPAGQTGILGVYLQPNPGQTIPPPGTPLSFEVTATSKTDPSITKTVTVTFTVPAIDAVTITADPTATSSAPGVPITETITLTNAGNVPEDVTLADTLPAGLSASGLKPVSLAVGQSATETVTLTPGSSTPLGSTLDATINASYGPSGSPVTQSVQIPVSVAVPGATAIANASVAAGQIGNTNLADRLSDLSTALTNLVQSPASPVYKSQASASLDAVVAQLSTDPYLGSFAPTLTADGAALQQANTTSAIQAALAQLGTDLGTVGTTLTDEAAHGFSLSLLGNSQVGQPEQPATYGIVLQNTGTQTTTYDLSISGVPSGVTAAFSQTSITLAPGQATSVIGGTSNLSVTLTSNSATQLGGFPFAVQATAEGATEITRSAAGSFAARASFVQVDSVTPSPAFTNPGGQVDVSAQILNAVNRQQQAKVSFTLTDAQNNVVYASQPVPTTLDVLTTLTPVDLGGVDTTNLVDGTYTINVTVTDGSGTPIPGATGTGRLLIGSPVTATVSSSPSTLPSGNGTVTTTLQINASNIAGAPFTLVGQTPISGGATSVAIDGQYAYVGESNGIDVVDVSNPASPTVIKTFGTTDFPGGSTVTVHIYGQDLLVDATTSTHSAFIVYSLANPTSPQLVGNTDLGRGFIGDNGFVVQGSNAYSSQWYFNYNVFNNYIGNQNGDLFSVDLSNLASPRIVGSLYGLSSGGSSFVFDATAVNSNTLLVASTTSTGPNIDTGEGQVLVVDTSDPANPTILGTVDIPGTIHLQDIAIDGDQAVVVGSSGGLSFDGTNFNFPGSLVLATLDLTNPEAPTLVSTQTFSTPYTFSGAIASLGNDLYVASSPGSGSASSALLLINAQDPKNIQITPFDVNAAPNDDEVVGNLLYTTSSDGLVIYNTASGETPVTAQVTIPTNTGVSIVANSFSIPPTNIVTGANSETLEWDPVFSTGNTSETITWQEAVTGLMPGESIPVVQGATVEFPIAPLLANAVDINPEVNANLATYTNGVNYPPGGTILNVGGIPFTLAGYAGGGTGVVQTAAGTPSTPDVVNIPVDVASPTTVYTLINSAFGQLGYTAGSIEFIGTGGADATFDLVEGQNIRDHNNDRYNNTIAQGTPAVFFGGGQVRLDRQTFVLPGAFQGQTLTDIRLSSFGAYPTGEPFLAAATVTTSPGQVLTSTITLPPTYVAGEQIIGLDPATQTVAPAAPASYNVTLLNPTANPVNYALSVQGVPASWVTVPGSVTVAANGSMNVPLVLTSDSFAPLSDYGFTVAASGDNGAIGSVQGDLVLQGQPVLPDGQSHGIVATLSPAQATAGQDTSATYVVQLTNTGSANDTFALSVSGLPQGIKAGFAETTIDVPPGASNFRDVTLTLTPDSGTAPGDIPFTVVATSTTMPTVTGSASGQLTVVGSGVQVRLSPSTGTPGSTFQMTVKNTGNATDTFKLSLGGPAALVATLGQAQVTLAPGASQTIPVTTADVRFAVPGNLPLTAIATSEANSAVEASATASLTVGPTLGLTAQLNPATQVLPIPGTTSFLLLVNNTGNTQDQYTAEITGTTGPVTASLVGLDGNPTQSIPLFILPGLSTGAILIQTDITGQTQGTVSVRVTSLDHQGMSASETATVAVAAPSATRTQLVPASTVATVGQKVTITAIVTPTSGNGTPAGFVTFSIDGTPQPQVALQTVDGKAEAVFSTSTLAVGAHTVTAAYDGNADFKGSAATATVQVNATAGGGPEVTDLKRFGYHMQPTVLVLTFDEALDPVHAQNPANYRIVTLGGHGQGGRRIGHVTKVRSAVYSPSAQTVTLYTAQRLDVHNVYRLTVNGMAPSGLTDTSGRFLDGRANGVPGSNFVGLISRRTLAGPSMNLKRRTEPAIRTRAVSHDGADASRIIERVPSDAFDALAAACRLPARGKRRDR